MRPADNDETLLQMFALVTRPEIGTPGDFLPEYSADDRTRCMRQCYECANVREVPGSCHVSCAVPDEAIRMDPHGIGRGWATYPVDFDPTWKRRLCRTFKPIAKEG